MEVYVCGGLGAVFEIHMAGGNKEWQRRLQCFSTSVSSTQSVGFKASHASSIPIAACRAC